MSTTNLFVELLVIGVGAAVWTTLLILSVLGVDWYAPMLLQTYAAAGLGLAVVYVLGVITDRVADFVFDRFLSASIRRQHFSTKRNYQDDRRMVMQESDRLADLHEYGRIRIRVARGWAINAVMIGLALQVFIFSQFPGESWALRASILSGLGMLGLAGGCWWSWSMLCSTEYLKIKEHAEFLARQKQPAASPLRKSA